MDIWWLTAKAWLGLVLVITLDMTVKAMEWITEYPQYSAPATILMIIVGIAMIAEWIRRRRVYAARKLWGELMDPTTREKYLKQLLGQSIHDGMFEAYCRGDITVDEYKQQCIRAGNLFDLSDLLPRQRKLLKNMIKDRLRAYEREPKHPLPGEKPKQEVVPNGLKPVATPTHSYSGAAKEEKVLFLANFLGRKAS